MLCVIIVFILEYNNKFFYEKSYSKIFIKRIRLLVLFDLDFRISSVIVFLLLISFVIWIKINRG